MKKKLLASLLACILCLNLTGTAFAREWDGGEITNDPENGPQLVDPKPDPGPSPTPTPPPPPPPPPAHDQ